MLRVIATAALWCGGELPVNAAEEEHRRPAPGSLEAMQRYAHQRLLSREMPAGISLPMRNSATSIAAMRRDLRPPLVSVRFATTNGLVHQRTLQIPVEVRGCQPEGLLQREHVVARNARGHRTVSRKEDSPEAITRDVFAPDGTLIQRITARLERPPTSGWMVRRKGTFWENPYAVGSAAWTRSDALVLDADFAILPDGQLLVNPEHVDMHAIGTDPGNEDLFRLLGSMAAIRDGTMAHRVWEHRPTAHIATISFFEFLFGPGMSVSDHKPAGVFEQLAQRATSSSH